MSIADIESRGIDSVLQAEASGDLHSRHPYIYASAEDLQVADVELLLCAYKELVRITLSLGRDLKPNLMAVAAFLAVACLQLAPKFNLDICDDTLQCCYASHDTVLPNLLRPVQQQAAEGLSMCRS